jgi:hypothetical protein
MADNIVADTTQQIAADAVPTIDPSVKEQMEFRLNGVIPGSQPDGAAQPATTTTTEPTVVVDHFGVLKEKFQYNSAEDAIAEIENLRKLKDAPLGVEDFENEESLKLFRAFQAGKKDEVYNYLSKTNQIDSLLSKEITPETAADYVKLGMQLKYPDLTEKEISFKFNKQFAIPPKPAQTPDEEPADYQARLEAWQQVADDKQMELLIEAKFAKPEVAKSKQSIVFPEITDDDGYIQYKKMLEQKPQIQEQQAKLDAETKAFYKAATPKGIETKVDFEDAQNKINFQFQYEPDPEGFAKAVEMASDIDKLWAQFYNQDGTPDRNKFLKFIYNGMNAEKLALEALKQSKNATIKASLPDNSSGGLNRQLVTNYEPSEIDKQMQLHGIGRRN